MSPRALVRKIRRTAQALERRHFERFLSSRHGARVREKVMGLDLVVPGTVLNPALFKTGPLLAEAVAGRVRPGEHVLDMGSGSGIVAIAAARHGAVAYAIDRNPDAVRATRVNAMLNRVEVFAHEGDLFEPLTPGVTPPFELIAFNPPFFEKQSDGSGLSLAFDGGKGLPVLDRFLAGAPAFLAPGGCVLIAGSTEGALGRMRELYAAHGWKWRTVARRERISERMVVDLLSRSS